VIKFVFGLFVVGCVFWGGSQVLDHFFPSLSTHVAFTTPIGPINWLLIGTCALCAGAYRMMK
jgi:hypothetical protein